MRKKARAAVPRVTAQQMVYAENVAGGMTPKAAARAAGYKGGGQAVYRLQNNAEIRRYVGEVLEGRGVTLDRVAEVLAEGLGATRVDTFLNKSTGKVVESRPLDDFATRHKFLESAIELLGAKGVHAEEQRSAGNYNVYIMAQQFNHLTDEQLAQAMSEAQSGDINLAKYGVSLPAQGEGE